MKTAVVTGISKGIGLACAKELVNRGLFVIGTTRDGNIPTELSTNEAAQIKVFELELSSRESIAKCALSIQNAVADSGIDILINNAGGLFDEDDTKIIINKLRETLEINLIGNIDFTEQIIPALSEKAHIVNVSSMAGSLTDNDEDTSSHYPLHYPAYRISKCALNMYTRTLALRLKHEDSRGIVVSSVHPGWVRTQIGGQEAPDLPEEVAKKISDLALSNPQSGQFWYKGEKVAW